MKLGKKMVARLSSFLKRRWGNLLYYACVLAVLCAVAYTAEVYRRENAPEAEVLPVVEIDGAERIETPRLVLPENVVCLRRFDAEPVWNDVLGQWELHTAMDLAFEENDVLALCGGIISDFGSDAQLGDYVEIGCRDLMIRYGSVKISPDLKTGDVVSAGDVLGEANLSMLREQYMPPHAHIEIVYRGKTIDPDEII